MISLIISYYRSLPNLRLILHALEKQSYKDFEVILAEDDESDDLPAFLTKHKHDFPFPVHHIHQPDDGFRKCRILNEAIRQSNAEFLVFLDGDCIPHPHFMMQYMLNAAQGYIFYGRRVMLGESISHKLLYRKIKNPPAFWAILSSDSQKIKEGIYSPGFPLSMKKRGMKGANWGVMKKHLYEVNGFDEDYMHAGVGEDVDIAWRLRSIGLHMKSMKNKAIVYHLFHHRTYSQEGVHHNYHLLADKKKHQGSFCLNGLVKSKA